MRCSPNFYFELQHNYIILINRFLLDVPSIPEHQFTPFYLDGGFGYARLNNYINWTRMCFRYLWRTLRTVNCSSMCEPRYTG